MFCSLFPHQSLWLFNFSDAYNNFANKIFFLICTTLYLSQLNLICVLLSSLRYSSTTFIIVEVFIPPTMSNFVPLAKVVMSLFYSLLIMNMNPFLREKKKALAGVCIRFALSFSLLLHYSFSVTNEKGYYVATLLKIKYWRFFFNFFF